MNTEYNRDTLLEMLHSRIVTLRFRKADDSIRVMNGTLKAELLPPTPPDKYDVDAINIVSDQNLLTVWDVNAEGWRSFHLDRLIEVN